MLKIAEYILENMGQPIDYFNNREIAERINPKISELKEDIISIIYNERLIKKAYKQIIGDNTKKENDQMFIKFLNEITTIPFYGDIITDQNRKLEQGLYTNTKDTLRRLKHVLKTPSLLKRIMKQQTKKNQIESNYI